MFRDHHEFLPSEGTPSFAITDISETFDCLAENGWVIPYGIRYCDFGSKERVQERIDQIFPKFLEHIKSARQGKEDIDRVRETGLLGMGDNITHYIYLRYNLWGNFPERTDNFWADINRVENSFIKYLSPDIRNQITEGLDFEEASVSEKDLEFTKKFMRSISKTMLKEIWYIEAQERMMSDED